MTSGRVYVSAETQEAAREADLVRRVATLELTLGRGLGPGGNGTRRNLFDNGGMRIAQRNVSRSGVGSGADYLTADRWYYNNLNVGVWSQDVVDVVIPGVGLRKALRTLVTTADAAGGGTDFLT